MVKSVANQIISPSQVCGKLANLHRVLEEAGLTYDELQMPIDDPDMRKQLVRIWKLGGYEPSIELRLAEMIMGSNYVGPETASQYFGAKFAKKETALISRIPFSEPTLKECKDSHILVLVPKISILDIRDKVERDLFYSHEDAWFNKNEEEFAKEKGEVVWQLIRKEPVPNSTSKNWEGQKARLLKDEEVPNARVMVYTIISHYKRTGERLFETIYVRTSSLASDGHRVAVGAFASWGLNVGNYWNDYRIDILGLSAARKLTLET